MVQLNAHYDGKVLVPDEPVTLPTNVPLRLTVEEQKKPVPQRSLEELIGLGAEIWEGIDPVEYQRREREGWE